MSDQTVFSECMHLTGDLLQMLGRASVMQAYSIIKAVVTICLRYQARFMQLAVVKFAQQSLSEAHAFDWQVDPPSTSLWHTAHGLLAEYMLHRCQQCPEDSLVYNRCLAYDCLVALECVVRPTRTGQELQVHLQPHSNIHCCKLRAH